MVYLCCIYNVCNEINIQVFMWYNLLNNLNKHREYDCWNYSFGRNCHIAWQSDVLVCIPVTGECLDCRAPASICTILVTVSLIGKSQDQLFEVAFSLMFEWWTTLINFLLAVMNLLMHMSGTRASNTIQDWRPSSGRWIISLVILKHSRISLTGSITKELQS